MNALWLAALLRLSQSAAPVVPPEQAPTATANWLVRGPRHGDPLLRRVEEISARFLDTPYVHSPLGEGEGIDPDPPIRFDAVDCLTFVEQTLALGLASTPTEAPALLQSLRYREHPVYADRNHLMEAQWLPNNLRKGFLRDVTRAYGGPDTVRVSKVITGQTWASGSSRALMLPEDARIEGTFGLEMIPLQKVARHARDIRSGTILVVVRADVPSRVTRVTHLGFVVQKDRRTWLRHAARNHWARVIDEDLTSFLTRNSKYAKWPVVGVALFEPDLPDPARTP